MTTDSSSPREPKRLPIVGQDRPQPPAQQPQGHPERLSLPGVKHLIAVASGKGGVGKSTVCVNLALGLKQLGARVGVMDADIYGPSIPLMLGAHEQPRLGSDRKLVPLDRYGLALMSLGFLIEEGRPVIWRGPMVQGVVRQFLTDVNWGELDYLMIDLPPGTGDAQITLVQLVSLAGGIIVTTPSDIALIDAEKGLAMFRQLDVPILGVVENMSHYICPHCEKQSEVFSSGGGRRIAEKTGAPLLGEVPLTLSIRKGGDEGRPVMVEQPQSAEAQAFLQIAEGLRRRCEGGSKDDEAGKQGFFSSLTSRK